MVARLFLVYELFQIPEFVNLWVPAVQRQAKVMECGQFVLRDRWSQLSPEGRGAFLALAMGSPAWRLYSDEVLVEIAGLVGRLKQAAEAVGRILDDEVDWYGSVSYRTTLESIVAPVRVPGLAQAIMAWNHKVWGWDQIGDPKAEIKGAFRNLVEGEMLEYLTDLTPAKLSTQTPTAIRRRLRQKMAPLVRHASKGEHPFHGVKQRVHLWALNKIHGYPIAEISASLGSDEDWTANGESPERWVKQQIREATRILGAEVAPGRPPKGSVVEQWKMLR